MSQVAAADDTKNLLSQIYSFDVFKNRWRTWIIHVKIHTRFCSFKILVYTMQVSKHKCMHTYIDLIMHSLTFTLTAQNRCSKGWLVWNITYSSLASSKYICTCTCVHTVWTQHSLYANESLLYGDEVVIWLCLFWLFDILCIYLYEYRLSMLLATSFYQNQFPMFQTGRAYAQEIVAKFIN